MKEDRMGVHCTDLIALVLLAFFFSLSTGCFSGTRLFEGILSPIDSNVCVSQNITFTSNLLNESVTNYSIGFVVKKPGINGTYVAVDSHKVNIVNQSMAQYIVYDVSFEAKDLKAPYYFYVRSYYWENSVNLSCSLMLGSMASARVFPLVEVKSFECIVHDYISMLCSWNYGEDYGENMPNVTFKWALPALSASLNHCKKLNIKEGICKWEEITDGYFKDSNLTITITLVHKCGINISSEFYVDTSKIVKPSSISKLSATVYNSTCIHLSWKISYPGLYNMEQRIKVYSEYDLFSTTFNTSIGYNSTICQLRPYTTFNFTVDVRPIGRYSGYWSDPKYIIAQTYSDIPSASPQVVEGGYIFNRRDCAGMKMTRHVCVFWKPIRKEQENGPLRGILGIFTAVRDERKQPTYVNWASNLTYGCSELMCNTTYDVIIKVRNINGTSKESSSLELPYYSPSISPPQFIVESDNMSGVYISLEKKEALAFTKGFTVVWCRNENGECKSTYGIDWKRVLSYTPEIVLQMNSSAHDFLYGVSGNTENGSSGVVWQDCVYKRNTVPKREPQNVQVSRGSEDNTLLVTWDKLTCLNDEPYIAFYDVTYRKPYEENRKTVNVPAFREAKAILKDLESDRTYIVIVRGVTKDGHYGPESQPQRGVPVNNSLSTSEIIGITMAVLVGILFAGVGLFCSIRRCKKKANAVLKSAGEITIPDIPDVNLLKAKKENSNCCTCVKSFLPENNLNKPRTENGLCHDHHKNDYNCIGKIIPKCTLSTSKTGVCNTEMIHDPECKLENETRISTIDFVAFTTRPEAIVIGQEKEINVADGSTKDRGSDYVKCKQPTSDSNSNKARDKSNDRYDSDENKCKIITQNIQRDEQGKQSMKDSSYIQLGDDNLRTNFQTFCREGSSDGFFSIGEDVNNIIDSVNSRKESKKHISPILFTDVNNMNRIIDGYLPHCASNTASDPYLINSNSKFNCPDESKDVNPTNIIYPKNVLASVGIPIIDSAPTIMKVQDPLNTSNPIKNLNSVHTSNLIDNLPTYVANVPNGYVFQPAEATVFKEVPCETNLNMVCPVAASDAKEIVRETNGHVLHPIETLGPKKAVPETNGYVFHPVKASCPKEVVLEKNGNVSNTTATTDSMTHINNEGYVPCDINGHVCENTGNSTPKPCTSIVSTIKDREANFNCEQVGSNIQPDMSSYSDDPFDRVVIMTAGTNKWEEPNHFNGYVPHSFT